MFLFRELEVVLGGSVVVFIYGYLVAQLELGATCLPLVDGDYFQMELSLIFEIQALVDGNLEGLLVGDLYPFGLDSHVSDFELGITRQKIAEHFSNLIFEEIQRKVYKFS